MLKLSVSKMLVRARQLVVEVRGLSSRKGHCKGMLFLGEKGDGIVNTEEESNFGRELQRKFVGKKKKPHNIHKRNKKNPKYTLNNSRTGKILKYFLDFLKEFDVERERA